MRLAICAGPTTTGKTSVFYALKGIYGQCFTEIGDKQLEDARNQWAIEKQLVLGDDVTGKDQRKYADRLKAMITQNIDELHQAAGSRNVVELHGTISALENVIATRFQWKTVGSVLPAHAA